MHTHLTAALTAALCVLAAPAVSVAQQAGAQVSDHLLRHRITLQADLLHLWDQSDGKDDSDQLQMTL